MVVGPVRHLLGHGLDHIGPLLPSKQVGHLAVVQDPTDVFDLAFLGDLGVVEQEHGLLLIDPGHPHDLLELFHPILGVDLDDVHARNESRQNGQRLTPAPSHSHQ